MLWAQMNSYLLGSFLDYSCLHMRHRHLYSTNHSWENAGKQIRSLDRVCLLEKHGFHLREILVVKCNMV